MFLLYSHSDIICLHSITFKKQHKTIRTVKYKHGHPALPGLYDCLHKYQHIKKGNDVRETGIIVMENLVLSLLVLS